MTSLQEDKEWLEEEWPCVVAEVVMDLQMNPKEMEIKKNKSTVPADLAQGMEQETTTMMTIRLSTNSVVEVKRRETTDIKNPYKHSISLTATLESEAEAVETCVCAVELVQAIKTTSSGKISVVDTEIVPCVAAA